MAKKIATTPLRPESIITGMEIVSRASKKSERVRSVSYVLHLDNGFDEVYEQEQLVQVVPAPPTEEGEQPQ